MENLSFALIIVDVQNDFCPGGALAVGNGDRIIPVINRIQPFFSTVVGTRDWHPPGHISFASAHQDARPFESFNCKGIEQMLWPDHCVRGSRGADFHDDLNTDYFTCIINKGSSVDLDSYSAFFENDKKTPTGLDGYLKSRGIRDLYVSGLATDYCVFYSAIDSLKCGFNTFCITDATLGVDMPLGSVESALKEMKAAGVGMITGMEIEERFK